MTQFRHIFALSLVASTLAITACGSAPMATTAPATTAATAPAAAIAMTGSLSAAKQVPTNASAGTGTVQASFDKQTSTLNWTVTYTGLTGPVRAAHFHGPALAGVNAGVALGMSGSLESPMKGSAILTAAQAADVLAGKWYVNLHTAANPGGEIRGQVDAAK